MRFEGKVAVITGGARGQGRSHALALAREGASIVLADVPSPMASVPYLLATAGDLAETAAMIEDAGGRVVAVPTDVRKSSDVNAMFETAIEEFGKIDLLVANAGIVSYSPLIDMNDETWSELIDVNLTGVAWTIRAALPYMVDRSYGRIVVTASQAARRGMPNLSHYCSAKWGLLGLVKTVALEMAPHLGITCNAVLPGGVDTPMMRNDAVYRVFAPELEDPRVEDLEERLRAFNPMPTAWIQPEDISHTVLYLLSEDARYVSGTAIDVAAAHNAT